MAAKQHLSGIDAVGIQTLNFRMQNLAAAPGSPYGVGHVYYDTTLLAPRYFNGTVWKNAFARGDHTGTQLSATISDLATTVQGYSLDLFLAPAANLNLNNKRITNLADPVNGQDAVTLTALTNAVQAAEAGISSKNPARVVATANVSALNGLPTVDGVALADGDRVLLTGQSTGSQNGPWVAHSGAWTRPTTEGPTWELDKGALWLVLDGTTNAGTQWRLTNTSAITPGTTAITVVQFGATQSFIAGYGITYVSGTVSVKLAGSSGLVADSTGLYVDTAVVVRKFAQTIGDGSATSYTVTHNLGTKDITLSARNVGIDLAVEVDWTATSTSAVTITFGSAPATNSIRIVVHG